MRIKSLDALRGLASVFVVFFHLTMGRNVFRFDAGVTGVDLFFIISGFVIFMTLSKIDSPKEFIVGRFARLYPTYWTAVTLTFVGLLILGKGHWGDYFYNLTMFQQAFNVYDLDGTYWTLYVEILFYLFMLGIYCIKKLHKIVLIGSICLLLLPFYSILYAHPSISHKVPLVNHFPLFFAGILFYHIYNGVQNYLYYMLILFCFIMQCTLYDDVRSSNVISFYQYIAMLVLYFTVFLLFVNGRLNFIANKVTLFLGKVSYALYAVHEFLSLMILMPFFEPKFGFWPAALLSFLISLGVAYLITQHVEARAVKFIKAKSRKRQQIQGVPLINIVLQKPTSTSDFQNKKHS